MDVLAQQGVSVYHNYPLVQTRNHTMHVERSDAQVSRILTDIVIAKLHWPRSVGSSRTLPSFLTAREGRRRFPHIRVWPENCVLC